MPWKETNVLDQRIEFVARGQAPKVNLSSLCEEFGIARSTGYRWLRRFQEEGRFGSLRERSRRPKHSPNKTDSVLERRVLELRRQRGWGALKIHVLLLREGISLPVITIHRIMQRNGLLQDRRGMTPAPKRFERERPNELWQMDFKGEFRTGEEMCYPLSLLDDHSRYAVGLHGLSSTKGKGVQQSLVKTFEEYGLPQEMLMDHGSPWWSTTNPSGLTWVSVWLLKQGIDLHFSGIGHPQTQGKVERFHRTLKESLRHHGHPESRNFLERFREEYNYIRPHEALGLDVPASRYEKSSRPYRANPEEWEYPSGSDVRRLNSQGMVTYGRRRYFVCEALSEEQVKVEEVSGHLLVSYRQMYVREIDLEKGKSLSLVLPH